MKEKVSIILPVYNAESTLPDCIKSIQSLHYENFEVILVNDGSSDNSKLICEQFVREDSRAILINQENSGVSCARNKGLEKASGTFFTFVDSDDIVFPGLFNYIEENDSLPKVDIVIVGSEEIGFHEQRQLGIPPSTLCKDRRELLNFVAEYVSNPMFRPPWAKIFRLDVAHRNSLRFNEHMSLGEDTLFNFDYIDKANSLCTIASVQYSYRKTQGSLVDSSTPAQWLLYYRKLKAKISAMYPDWREKKEIIAFFHERATNTVYRACAQPIGQRDKRTLRKAVHELRELSLGSCSGKYTKVAQTLLWLDLCCGKSDSLFRIGSHFLILLANLKNIVRRPIKHYPNHL